SATGRHRLLGRSGGRVWPGTSDRRRSDEREVERHLLAREARPRTKRNPRESYLRTRESSVRGARRERDYEFVVSRVHPRTSVAQLTSSPHVARALRFFETHAESITEEHIRICSVPATPFAEHERAEYLRHRFSDLGMTEVEIDPEGNCLGLIEGASRSPLLVVSAHLDTVFAKDTDFTVTRRDYKLFAPGIADDGCGLAALIALAQVIRAEQVPIKGSILFVGTVGEEGEGNLRGVRYLFTRGRWASKVDAFVSFDGPGLDRITNRALGSRRYRIEMVGPGGHSWGDFGLPNPVHALGRAISRLAAYPAP